MKYRYRITLDNAKKMLEIAHQKKSKVKLIGSVQGWSPKTYHSGIKELIRAGFDYVALGGVAKAPNETIIPILHEIRETVVKAKAKLHVLGVARLNMLDEYKKANVASCDSASSIMQAFKSNKENYHTPEKNYTAVRIPAVQGHPSPKVRKLLRKYAEEGDPEDIDKRKIWLANLENAALCALREYAAKNISLKKAMNKLVEYEDQFGDEKKYYPLFEEVLYDRPWEKCHCAICKSIGVDVILLRGNNRNRRRGFHNTYVFYKMFKEKSKEKS